MDADDARAASRSSCSSTYSLLFWIGCSSTATHEVTSSGVDRTGTRHTLPNIASAVLVMMASFDARDNVADKLSLELSGIRRNARKLELLATIKASP